MIYSLTIHPPDDRSAPFLDNQIKAIAQQHQGRFAGIDSGPAGDGAMWFGFDTLEQAQAAVQEMRAKCESVTAHELEVLGDGDISYFLPKEDGRSRAYENCVGWMLDYAENTEDVFLVHGYPTYTGGLLKGRRFAHVWIEIDGSHCLDGNRFQEYPLEQYYREGNIDPALCHKYTFNEVCTDVSDEGIAGPWHEAPVDALVGSVAHDPEKGPFESAEAQPARVKLPELEEGPIRHELYLEDLKLARYTYHLVGKYVQTSLERWELGFMCNAHPRQKLAWWAAISHALETWARDNPKKATEAGKQEFYELLFAAGNGVGFSDLPNGGDPELFEEAKRRFETARKTLPETIRRILETEG